MRWQAEGDARGLPHDEECTAETRTTLELNHAPAAQGASNAERMNWPARAGDQPQDIARGS
eukprot:6241101-Pyramimonas_sp.AAC.1